MLVDVTSKAKDKLNELLEGKEAEKSLRIYIAGYGWGGPTFGMALEEAKDGDEKVATEGFNFVVEEDLKEIYEQFTIDYSDSWLRKGFVVYPTGQNPDGGC